MNTLIDIKTDINTKSLKKYLKQVFMQAILYSSFLQTNRHFDHNLNTWEIDMINQPIKNIAIYYWRTNEFFKYNIEDVISIENYQKLVAIYTSLQNSHSTMLRHLLGKGFS